MKIQYRKVGDYFLPMIEGPKPLTHPLSKIGRMYREHMQKHYPVTFNVMMQDGTWTEHLQEIDDTARRRIDQIMDQLIQQEGITENLKASDPMRWVGLMNNFKAQAEEIVTAELVFGERI